jgi:hypothetical protein
MFNYFSQKRNANLNNTEIPLLASQNVYHHQKKNSAEDMELKGIFYNVGGI